MTGPYGRQDLAAGWRPGLAGPDVEPRSAWLAAMLAEDSRRRRLSPLGAAGCCPAAPAWDAVWRPTQDQAEALLALEPTPATALACGPPEGDRETHRRPRVEAEPGGKKPGQLRSGWRGLSPRGVVDLRRAGRRRLESTLAWDLSSRAAPAFDMVKLSWRPGDWLHLAALQLRAGEAILV